LNYIEYSTQDFLADESFQDYILGNNPLTVQFWTDWLRQHPEKEPAASEAATLLAFLSSGKRLLPSSTTKSAEAAKLWAAINPPLTPD
jgi:transmembrane sensor